MSMKVERFSLSIPNFDWVSTDKATKESLLCEAFLRLRVPSQADLSSFTPWKPDPPDVIISFPNQQSLRVEVTERIPYKRQVLVQNDRLVKALKLSIRKRQIRAPIACNIVLGLYPEHELTLSTNKLLNNVDLFAKEIEQFLMKTNVSSEDRILRIYDGDISITFVPAQKDAFPVNPRNLINNMDIRCWDGIFLDRNRNAINEIIAEKNEKLVAAIARHGAQSETDVLIIWTTNPVELLDGIQAQVPDTNQYKGIYYLFIMNLPDSYIAQLGILKENNMQQQFFVSLG